MSFDGQLSALEISVHNVVCIDKKQFTGGGVSQETAQRIRAFAVQVREPEFKHSAYTEKPRYSPGWPQPQHWRTVRKILTAQWPLVLPNQIVNVLAFLETVGSFSGVHPSGS